MSDFLDKPPEEKQIFIQQGALRSGFGQPVVEKDFWVCWLLRKLFSLPALSEHLIFKGGTSLSKAYGLIHRFSEDVDISIDRAFLGFQESTDTLAALSNTARQRRLEELTTCCAEAIKRQVVPALTQLISAELKDNWRLEISGDDPLAVLFHFPSVLDKEMFSYITPHVKIEFGARADPWPQEEKPIRSYLSEVFPDQASKGEGGAIRVLGVGRTFWEKATILHAEYFRPEAKALPNRLSRHYYDLYILSTGPAGEAAAADTTLLERVVKHKQVFFRSSWARYAEAKPGTLKLLPPAARIAAVRADYERMRAMFFAAPPPIGVVLDGLKELEERINS